MTAKRMLWVLALLGGLAVAGPGIGPAAAGGGGSATSESGEASSSSGARDSGASSGAAETGPGSSGEGSDRACPEGQSWDMTAMECRAAGGGAGNAATTTGQ
jgi:hypothetical protein